MLYFGRFLAENILSIILKVHFPRWRVGYYGILTKKPENKDAERIFFNGKFSEDVGGGIWIQCFSCSLWAHLDCTGAENEDYIRDFCK